MRDLSDYSSNHVRGSFRLIDCREEDEYAICRIGNAELIPLSNFKSEALKLLSGDDTRPVIIYCHHGMRSLQAVNFLRERGLTNVWSLAGGVDQWSREIDPYTPRY